MVIMGARSGSYGGFDFSLISYLIFRINLSLWGFDKGLIWARNGSYGGYN